MSPARRNLKYGARVRTNRNGHGPVAQLGWSDGVSVDPRKSIWLLTRWSGVRSGNSPDASEFLRTSPRARDLPEVQL